MTPLPRYSGALNYPRLAWFLGAISRFDFELRPLTSASTTLCSSLPSCQYPRRCPAGGYSLKDSLKDSTQLLRSRYDEGAFYEALS